MHQTWSYRHATKTSGRFLFHIVANLGSLAKVSVPVRSIIFWIHQIHVQTGSNSLLYVHLFYTPLP